MTIQARPYQVEDLSTLITNPRTGLFHDPGGGKTYIAALFTQYIYEATKERIVWTQPGGIIAKNKRDILASTNFTSEEVALVQGTKSQRMEMYNNPSVKVFLMTGVGYANEWEFLPADVRHSVHDEIHLYYTTHNAARTQNWYRACKNKKAIVPMTGTIIKGRLDSAYPVCHVLAPWAYGNDRAFVQHHAWFDENGRVIGWKNHDRLKEVLKRIGIFRSFKSIYGEEEKVIQVQVCQLSDKVRSLYKKLEESGLIELQDEFVDAGNPAVSAMRARQLLSCPEQFEIIEKTEKDEALLVDIEDHIKSGEPLAIFAVFTKEQERIVKLIQSLGQEAGLINGTVSNVRRQELDQRFVQGKLQFMVASPPTAGIGFNWSHLNEMIFASVDYTDDSFIQAYRRGIRGIRSQPLRIKILKYEDTIEQRILEIIDRKSRDHHLINDGINELNLALL